MSDSKLEFKLDPKSTAIVVIDLQKGIAALPGAPLDVGVTATLNIPAR
jgi:nicotinamidase-related amidase